MPDVAAVREKLAEAISKCADQSASGSNPQNALAWANAANALADAYTKVTQG
jgi:hypothetical protein